ELHFAPTCASSASFFLCSNAAPTVLHSFPTRRSSDLHSGRMSVTIPEILAHYSPLGYSAGDVVSTGTVSGVAGFSEDAATPNPRSEEHTSELQSQSNLVCRLLLEKKKLT